MVKQLNGKVAVITGGARGIGKAVATELAGRGCKIVIGDLLDKEGEETVRELNARAGAKIASYLHTNVVSYNDNIALFQQAEKEFGGVDIAFLNAGIINGSAVAFTPLDDKKDEQVISVNTIGVIKGTKVALLHLAKRGGGVIICTSSVAGFHPDPELLAYNASKHAVIGWIKSFGMMPAVCNVRVNAVCPHTVLTDMVTASHLSDVSLATQNHLPVTPIAAVVRAAMDLIEDDTANKKAMLILPGSVIREQISTPLPPEGTNPAFIKELKDNMPKRIAGYKKELAEAIDRYFKAHL